MIKRRTFLKRIVAGAAVANGGANLNHSHKQQPTPEIDSDASIGWPRVWIEEQAIMVCSISWEVEGTQSPVSCSLVNEHFLHPEPGRILRVRFEMPTIAGRIATSAINLGEKMTIAIQMNQQSVRRTYQAWPLAFQCRAEPEHSSGYFRLLDEVHA